MAMSQTSMLLIVMMISQKTSLETKQRAMIKRIRSRTMERKTR